MPRHRPFFTKERPPWWPENEAWPPVRGHLRHNPFFRRMGCALAAFNLLGFAVFFLAATWIANLLGLAHLPETISPWLLPLRVGVLVFVLAVGLLGFFGLRRVLRPLDELLDAAGRVAEGDYAIRVTEKGPREVRSLARAFNNMAARLHDTDEKRRNLLADVTHELRTPLTVIRGNLEGMLDGVYPASETNLRALMDETDLLARLVEDLRVLALAESGALQLCKEACDIASLACETLGSFQTQADTAGVTLAFDAPAGLPTLDVDAVRLRQVFSNLISNALRYSPSGASVRVTCAVLEGCFVLEVQDAGPGIPPADLPHIFERFYKSADSGGMGLGLAIARTLVTAHGGSISATNAPVRGSILRVSLPTAAA